MANRAQLQRLMVGALLYFIREGDVVDTLTVSETVKPDNAPTDNWPKIGEVSGVTFDKESKVNEFMVIGNNGRPRKQFEEIVLADFIDIRLENTFDVVNELLFGINKVTLGTAQVPFKNADRSVTGWLKAEVKNSNTGANFNLFDLWVELRLKNASTAMDAAEPVRPEIRVQALGADLDTLVFPTVS